MGCQLVYYMFVVVCECILSIWNHSSFKAWLSRVGGISITSFELQEFNSFCNVRAMASSNSICPYVEGKPVHPLMGPLMFGQAPEDINSRGQKRYLCRTGKTLNVCSPFRLLLYTASEKKSFA